jgi:hypothetical protein
MRFGLPVLLTVPAVGWGQAALEYAARSAGASAVLASDGGAIAGCPVDSALASCLGRSYPRTSLAVAAFIALVLIRMLARRVRGAG